MLLLCRVLFGLLLLRLVAARLPAWLFLQRPVAESLLLRGFLFGLFRRRLLSRLLLGSFLLGFFCRVAVERLRPAAAGSRRRRMDLLRSVWRRCWLGLFRCRFDWFDRGAGGAVFTTRATGGGVAARRFCSAFASSGLPGFACNACCFCAKATGGGGGATLATTGRLTTAAGGFGGALAAAAALAGLALFAPITLALHGSHRRGVNRRTRRDRARSDFHRCLCHRLAFTKVARGTAVTAPATF